MADIKVSLDTVEQCFSGAGDVEAYVFDRNGRLLVHKKGEEGCLGFEDCDLDSFAQGVLIRNLVSAQSLTEEDVLFLIDQKLRELRAVSKEYVFTFQVQEHRRQGRRQTLDELGSVLTNIIESHIGVTLTPGFRYEERVDWHKVWGDVSNRLGWLSYSRTPRLGR